MKKQLNRMMAFFLTLVMLASLLAGLPPYASAEDSYYLTDLNIIGVDGFVFNPSEDTYIVSTATDYMTFFFTYDTALATVYFQNVTEGATTPAEEVTNKYKGFSLGSSWDEYTIRITVEPKNGETEQVYTIRFVFFENDYITNLYIKDSTNTINLFDEFDFYDTTNLSYNITVGPGLSAVTLDVFIAAGASFTITSDNPADTALHAGLGYSGTKQNIAATLAYAGLYQETKTTFTIIVTPAAATGKSEREYKVTVTRRAASVADPYLRSMEAAAYAGDGTENALSIDFDKNQYTYYAAVEYDFAELEVFVIPELDRSQFSLEGGTVSISSDRAMTGAVSHGTFTDKSGPVYHTYDTYRLENIPLAEGENNIAIEVTSPSTAVYTYTLVITRKLDEPERRDTTLSVLDFAFDDGTSAVSLKEGEFAYTAEFYYDNDLRINATPTNSEAEVTIGIEGVPYLNGAIPKEDIDLGTVITIDVAAKYGTPPASSTYTITLADTSPPVLTDITVDEVTQIGAKLSFISSEEGSYYYVIRRKGSTAPTANTIKAGTEYTLSMGLNEITLDISALPTNSEYVVYMLVADIHGNYSGILREDFGTAQAPIASISSAAIYTDNTGTITFTTDMAGSYYYVVTKYTTSPLLSPQQVIDAAGVAADGITYYSTGTAATLAGTHTININTTGLMPNDIYTVQFVCLNDVNYYSNVAVGHGMVSIYTTALTGTLTLADGSDKLLSGGEDAEAEPYVTRDIIAKLEDSNIPAGTTLTYTLRKSDGGASITNTTGVFLGTEIGVTYIGKTITVSVNDGSGTYVGSIIASATYAVAKIPAPLAPGEVGTVDTVNATQASSYADGQITGLLLNTAYELSHDGGENWVTRTSDTSGVIDDLPAGYWLIREKVDLTFYAGLGGETSLIIQKTSTDTPETFVAMAVDVRDENMEWGKITGLDDDTPYLYQYILMDEDDGAYETWGTDWTIIYSTNGELTELRPGKYRLQYVETDEITYTYYSEFTIEPSVPWDDGEITVTAGNRITTATLITEPTNGGRAIVGYFFRIYTEDEPDVFLEEIYMDLSLLDPDEDVTVTFEDLDNGTVYIVRVFAVNALGESVPNNRLMEDTVTPVAPNTACQVVYDLGEHGSSTDRLTERVIRGRKPVSVPVVTADEGYEFLGWSLDGETIVDPAEVVISRATTFCALYKEAGEAGYGYYTAYVNGYADNTFRPDAYMTRAEAAAIAARVIQNTMPITGIHTSSFNDTPADAWYANAVGFIESIGIMYGDGNGCFRPDDYITREEFMMVITRAAEYLGISADAGEGENSFSDADDISEWAESYVYAAGANGWMTGYNDNIEPTRYITRAEVVKAINTMLGRIITDESGKENDFTGFTDIEGHWAYMYIMEASRDRRYRIVDGIKIWEFE